MRAAGLKYLAVPTEFGFVDVAAADLRQWREQDLLLSPLTGRSGQHA